MGRIFALAAILVAGCSSSGSNGHFLTNDPTAPGQDTDDDPGSGTTSSGGTSSSGSVDQDKTLHEIAQRSALDDYMSRIALRQFSNAKSDSDAAKFADVMNVIGSSTDPVTIGASGATRSICGSQWIAACFYLVNFTFDTNDRLTSFDIGGSHVFNWVRSYPVPNFPKGGKFSSVALRGVLIDSIAATITVAMEYVLTNDADVLGCYPQEATYTVSGGSAKRLHAAGGAPQSTDAAPGAIMVVSFASPDLFGNLVITCKRQASGSPVASETYTIVPQ